MHDTRNPAPDTVFLDWSPRQTEGFDLAAAVFLSAGPAAGALIDERMKVLPV